MTTANPLPITKFTDSAGVVHYSDQGAPRGVASRVIGNTAEGQLHTAERQKQQSATPAAKGSAEADQEKARLQFENTDKPAYYNLVDQEKAAFDKANAAYGPYSASYSKLNSDLQATNGGFIDSKNIHDTVGALTAGLGLIADRAPPFPRAVAKVVIFGVDFVNQKTRAKVAKREGEEPDKLSEAADEVGENAGHLKNGAEALDAYREASLSAKLAKGLGIVTKSVEGTPFTKLGVVSDLTSIASAANDIAKPADLLDGGISTDKQLDGLSKQINDTYGGWGSGFDAHKQELLDDVQDLKPKLAAYDEANAEYKKIHDELQEAATTFIESAKKAHVPVG